MSFIACDMLEVSHGFVWDYTGVNVSWSWWKCGRFYCCPEISLWFLWISVACVLCVTFHNLLILNIEELLDFLAPRLEDHPLSAVHHSLFNIFLASVHIWRPALHPQHEDVLFCDCRGPFNVVMVTEGARCCDSRDRLDMIMASENNCKLNLPLMYV